MWNISNSYYFTLARHDTIANPDYGYVATQEKMVVTSPLLINKATNILKAKTEQEDINNNLPRTNKIAIGTHVHSSDILCLGRRFFWGKLISAQFFLEIQSFGNL